MIRLNVREAKTRFSHFLDQVAQGETIIVCKRNVPIAEIRPVPKPEDKPVRKIGLAKGQFKVTKEFFDPLPQDIFDAFSGTKK